MRFIKKILERGTITIPSDVREALGVAEGDIVEFQIVRIVKRTGDLSVTSSPATLSQPTRDPANAPRTGDA